MIISICGTPGVGKTTISKEIVRLGEEKGSKLSAFTVKELIFDLIPGSSIVITGKGPEREIEIDTDLLRNALNDWARDSVYMDIILEGHLAYLAPSDICIVLRLEPLKLRDRLKERGYSYQKVRENVEAEALGSILISAVREEGDRLEGRSWQDLPKGAGTVFEIDTTDITPEEAASEVLRLADASTGKRLNDLATYRPGSIDWLEVIGEWFWKDTKGPWN